MRVVQVGGPPHQVLADRCVHSSREQANPTQRSLPLSRLSAQVAVLCVSGSVDSRRVHP